MQEFLGLTVHDADRLEHHPKLPVPPMLPETREMLADYYRPHNKGLSKATADRLGSS